MKKLGLRVDVELHELEINAALCRIGNDFIFCYLDSAFFILFYVWVMLIWTCDF